MDGGNHFDVAGVSDFRFRVLFNFHANICACGIRNFTGQALTKKQHPGLQLDEVSHIPVAWSENSMLCGRVWRTKTAFPIFVFLLFLFAWFFFCWYYPLLGIRIACDSRCKFPNNRSISTWLKSICKHVIRYTLYYIALYSSIPLPGSYSSHELHFEKNRIRSEWINPRLMIM